MLKIGILEGDDIGLEVVPEAVKVMKAAAAKTGLKVEWLSLPLGKKAHETHGHTMPDSTVEALKSVDPRSRFASTATLRSTWARQHGPMVPRTDARAHQQVRRPAARKVQLRSSRTESGSSPIPAEARRRDIRGVPCPNREVPKWNPSSTGSTGWRTRS